MPCSICHQCGHNKRTCPQLITFKEVEVVVAPLKIFNSSVEVEIGFLSLVFQLPKEVELVIKRLSRARPLLTQHDIEFSQSKLEVLREKKCRGDFMNVWEQENGRRWSLERSTTIPFETGTGGVRDFKERCQLEWGKGTSKNKTEYQLYYRAVKFAAAQGRSAIIGDTRNEEEIAIEIDAIVERIEKLKASATGVGTLREIQTLHLALRACWKRLREPFLGEGEKKPFKKLTMKSLPYYSG
tara:strand:+ start:435 stop:1157 length:723 start_codon:yes stop_codon:yes gene_type:complete